MGWYFCPARTQGIEGRKEVPAWFEGDFCIFRRSKKKCLISVSSQIGVHFDSSGLSMEQCCWRARLWERCFVYRMDDEVVLLTRGIFWDDSRKMDGWKG